MKSGSSLTVTRLGMTPNGHTGCWCIAGSTLDSNAAALTTSTPATVSSAMLPTNARRARSGRTPLSAGLSTCRFTTANPASNASSPTFAHATRP